MRESNEQIIANLKTKSLHSQKYIIPNYKLVRDSGSLLWNGHTPKPYGISPPFTPPYDPHKSQPISIKDESENWETNEEETMRDSWKK